VHRESGPIGKVLNAFDTTINVRTKEDELLVISLGKVRSPANLNVISKNSVLGFKQIIGQDAKAAIHQKTNDRSTMELSIEDVVIRISEYDNFRNHFDLPEPDAIRAFANNSNKIFSTLMSQARSNRFGCLLNPDITTRGLFAAFTDQLVRDMAVLDVDEFKDKISKELLDMCGKGPGFTPAGDDFIAGYLAMSNWLNGSMNLEEKIIPGRDFLLRTTWTSFKLIEYSAKNLLDDQAQEMINCIGRNDIDGYIRAIELVSKRGHTSGIDFATGMTIALFTVADREFKTRGLENLMRITTP
jgi:hypothetical protein